jgi:CheY-like chemotaxis protein
MHGGAIGFASNSRIGSTFSFYIKGRRSQVSQSDSSSHDAITPNLHSQASFLSNRPFHKADTSSTHPNRRPSEDDITDTLHVLIVEDNLVNQRVLAKQLRQLGMVVAVANHGGEAIEYLRNTKFDTATGESGKELSLILMDWEMPVMDGLTCVRNIRQMQKNGTIQGHIPVIAVTANVRSEQVEIAIDAGMDDVVAKPFRVVELSERIRKLLRSMGT